MVISCQLLVNGCQLSVKEDACGSNRKRPQHKFLTEN